MWKNSIFYIILFGFWPYCFLTNYIEPFYAVFPTIFSHSFSLLKVAHVILVRFKFLLYSAFALFEMYRFDIIVNGGDSVTLSFQRSSFLADQTTVFVPWNEYVVTSDVVMRTPSQPYEPNFDSLDESCDPSRLPEPLAYLLTDRVRAYTDSECSERGKIIPEIQVRSF